MIKTSMAFSLPFIYLTYLSIKITISSSHDLGIWTLVQQVNKSRLHPYLSYIIQTLKKTHDLMLISSVFETGSFLQMNINPKPHFLSIKIFLVFVKLFFQTFSQVKVGNVADMPYHIIFLQVQSL
jgi:hypothetical protein